MDWHDAASKQLDSFNENMNSSWAQENKTKYWRYHVYDGVRGKILSSSQRYQKSRYLNEDKHSHF